MPSLSQFLKLFGNISDSFKLWQFRTKKAYIAVTYFEHFRMVTPIDNFYNYITYALIYFLCTSLKLPYISLFLYYKTKDELLHWVKTTNSSNTLLDIVGQLSFGQFVIWPTDTSPTLEMAQWQCHWVGIKPLFWFSLVISWCVL